MSVAIVAQRPNYAARRAAAGALATVVLVVTIAIAVVALGSLSASLGGAPAVAAEARPAVDGAVAPSVHVARPGDTLWSIASEHRGDVSHQRFVDALVRLNGGAAIQVGQAVRLP